MEPRLGYRLQARPACEQVSNFHTTRNAPGKYNSEIDQ